MFYQCPYNCWIHTYFFLSLCVFVTFPPPSQGVARETCSPSSIRKPSAWRQHCSCCREEQQFLRLQLKKILFMYKGHMFFCKRKDFHVVGSRSVCKQRCVLPQWRKILYDFFRSRGVHVLQMREFLCSERRSWSCCKNQDLSCSQSWLLSCARSRLPFLTGRRISLSTGRRLLYRKKISVRRERFPSLTSQPLASVN